MINERESHEESIKKESGVTLRISGNNPNAVDKFITKNGWEAIAGVKMVIVEHKNGKNDYLIIDPEWLAIIKSGEFANDQLVTKEGTPDVKTFDKVFGEEATVLNTSEKDAWKIHREAMAKVLSEIKPEVVVEDTMNFVNQMLGEAGENNGVRKINGLDKKLSDWTMKTMGGPTIFSQLGNKEDLAVVQKNSNHAMVISILTKGLIRSTGARAQIITHLLENTEKEELKPILEGFARNIARHKGIKAGEVSLDEAVALYVSTAEIAGISSTDTTQSASLALIEHLEVTQNEHPDYWKAMKEELQPYETSEELAQAIMNGKLPTVGSFVLESMRLSGVVRYSAIKATKDISLPEGDEVIPAGSYVYPMYSLISENPNYWQNGFWPDRFFKEMSTSSITTPDHLLAKGYPYEVFGGGSDRNCSGRAQATLALNALTAVLMKTVMSENTISETKVRRAKIQHLTVANPIRSSSMTLKRK